MTDVLKSASHTATKSLNSIANPASSCQVAFSLSDFERNQFFGGCNQTVIENAEFQWLHLNHNGENSPAKHNHQLKALKPRVLVSGWRTPSLSEELMDSLEYVCHVTGSVRHVVPRSFIEKGHLVSNWGSLISDTVAEHALLLILSCLREVPRWHDTFAGPYTEKQQSIKTNTLFGRRVGIHGFGRVARHLVDLLKPFCAKISAFSVGVPDDLFTSMEVRKSDSLETLFSQNDIVVECEALSPLTRHSITSEVLNLLPKDGVFVNVARGGLVDEDALVRLASKGNLRVGLDVVEHEPLAVNSPLLQLPNVVVSPHIAGPTTDRFLTCGEFALRNIAAFLNGEAVESLLTVDDYDRST